MPIPEVDRLERGSSQEQIKAAKSACIAAEIKAGHPQDQAIAMCTSMISEKTGTNTGPKD